MAYIYDFEDLKLFTAALITSAAVSISEPVVIRPVVRRNVPLAQSSVSQHLKVLKETGWIQGEIDGPRVCYCTVEGIVGYYLALMNGTLYGK